MFGEHEIDWTAHHTLGVRCSECGRELTIKVSRVFMEDHEDKSFPSFAWSVANYEARRWRRIDMNHYLIRDAQNSPQAVTAKTLDEALPQLGLDAADISRAEVMIAGALPPGNWQDVTPPKRKKLTTEQKKNVEVLQRVNTALSNILACEGYLQIGIENLKVRISQEIERLN